MLHQSPLSHSTLSGLHSSLCFPSLLTVSSFIGLFQSSILIFHVCFYLPPPSALPKPPLHIPLTFPKEVFLSYSIWPQFAWKHFRKMRGTLTSPLLPEDRPFSAFAAEFAVSREDISAKEKEVFVFLDVILWSWLEPCWSYEWCKQHRVIWTMKLP